MPCLYIFRSDFPILRPFLSAMPPRERHDNIPLSLQAKFAENTLNRIEHIQSELNQAMADYSAAETAYENGEMEYP